MRLTDEANIISALEDDSFALMCFLKLKKYEDTGLEPDDVYRLRGEVSRLRTLLNSVRKELSDCAWRK